MPIDRSLHAVEVCIFMSSITRSRRSDGCHPVDGQFSSFRDEHASAGSTDAYVPRPQVTDAFLASMMTVDGFRHVVLLVLVDDGKYCNRQ